MKLREVVVNRRKKQLEQVTRAVVVFPMPFAQLDPRPSVKAPLVEAFVDRELGNEAVTFTLASGRDGAVHLDHALYCNRDPAYLTGLALNELTCDALAQMQARRLGK